MLRGYVWSLGVRDVRGVSRGQFVRRGYLRKEVGMWGEWG